MSEQDDALREMAANRGCKLVKSRRRKPGGDFGRYGLKDAKTGKADMTTSLHLLMAALID